MSPMLLFVMSMSVVAADNITDCDYVQNRVSSQDGCFCDSAECVFEFNLEEGDTVEAVTWITCDHRGAKEVDPSVSTQCVVSCNAPSSCNEFVLETYGADQVVVECDALSSCDLMEIHVVNDRDGGGHQSNGSHSEVDVVCLGLESCGNLQIHCPEDTECSLQCQSSSCSVRIYALSLSL